MTAGTLETRLSANTTGFQAGMAAAATAAERESKRMQSFINAVSKSLKDQEAASKQMAAAAKSDIGSATQAAEKLKGAHAGVGRELIVLAHEMSQGNFKRFGGSMLVLAERLDLTKIAMTGMGAAAILGTVAVGGLVAEIALGAIEANRFERSLIATGNAAGLTLDSLNAMSKHVAATTGGTVGSSRSALEGLTASGRFGAGVLEPAAHAIVQLERLTGSSADEIIKDFARMQDGAAKWAAEANQQYHFLNATQYEHIRIVEQMQGTEEANRETLKLLNNQLDLVNGKVGESIGLWQQFKNTMSAFVDSVQNVGRPGDTLGAQIDAIDKQLARMRNLGNNPALLNLGDLPATPGNIAQLEEQRRTLLHQQTAQNAAAEMQASAAATNEAAIKARQHLDAMLDEAKGANGLAIAMRKLHEEFEKAAKGGMPVTATEQASLEAELRRKHSDRVANSQATEYAALTARIKEFNAESEQELSHLGPLTEGQKFLLKVQQELATAGRKLSESQRAATLADAEKAAAARDVADAEVRAQKATYARIGADAANQHAQQGILEQVLQGGNDQANALYRQMALIGKSAEEVTRVQELQKFDDLVGKALLGADADTVKRIQEIAAVLRGDLVQALDDAKAAQDAYNASFQNGFHKAMDEYSKQAQNNAAFAEKVFNDATQGMTDALTQFAMTGKLSFKGLIDSMISDLIRFEIQKGIAGVFGGSSSAGTAGNAAGSIDWGNLGQYFGVSFANGLDYVPYDGFRAVLHEGEKVTRKQDAANERSRGGQAVQLHTTVNVGQGVSRAEVTAGVQTGMAQVEARVKRLLQTGKV